MPKGIGDQNATPEERDLMLRMRKEGIHASIIAKTFNRSVGTIYRTLSLYHTRGHNYDLPRSGRPKKITERTSRHFKSIINENRHQTLADLTNTINVISNASVSTKTVRRMIGSLGMGSRIARPKPFLKMSHVERRLAWAEAAKSWGAEEWTKVIWTDESSIELGKNSRVCRVWRVPGEAYDEGCLVPTFKSGRTSVMVWGCVAYNRKGPLIFLPKDRRTGHDYVELILAGPLWDFYKEIYDERGVAKVMEDGAPTHTSKAAKTFREMNSLETIPHPAQSPDLNPIEHVWKQLKMAVNKRSQIPRDADSLRNALLEEWDKLDLETINRMIESMPDRVDAVLKAKGRSTRY
jgi:transposase